MDRVQRHYSALIEAAYALIPAGLHSWIRPHFLCGTDPVYAGLHRYEQANLGRSYRNTAHVAYDYHQPTIWRPRRRTTVVLPEDPRKISRATLVHELGHVLDGALGFDHDALPITEYAGTDRREAFAEAFAAWALPFGHGYGAAKERLFECDRRTVALLDGLVADGQPVT